MLFLLLTCFLIQRNNGLQQQTTLDAQTVSQFGASIIHNPRTTSIDIQSSAYNVVVTDQETAYDLKLSLNDSWAFKPQTISTLSITLNGNTPFPTLDTDLLLVFSVSDLQYFSFFIHLDSKHNLKSRIYSSLDQQHIARPVSEWISDASIHSRWDRISNNNQWQIIAWNKQALWPLRFVIINDPFHDQTVFQFYHNSTFVYAAGYAFNDAFVTDEAIDIYIMGDSINEMYTVSSIDILSNHEYLTTNPTANPSNLPTNNPTINPTQVPTKDPTITPSVTPSAAPTDRTTTSSAVTSSTDSAIVLSPVNTAQEPTDSSIITTTGSLPSRLFISSISGFPPNVQESKTDSETASFRIMIKVTFECNLASNPCKTQPHETIYNQVSILQDITQRIVNQSCTNTNVTSVQYGQMIVTSTVFICGEIWSSVSESVLQHELIQNIYKETDIEIVANQTMIIMLLADDFTMLDVNNTATYYAFNDTEIASAKVSHLPMQYEILIWTIKLIAIQMLLCCVLSICVFAIKLKTKQLKEQKAKVEKLRPKTDLVNAVQIASDTNLFQSNDIDESIFYLDKKTKPSKIPLCSTTIEPTLTTDTQHTYTSLNTQEDESANIVPIMLRILRNEAEKFVPQSTECTSLSPASVPTTLTSVSTLPSDRMSAAEPLPNVVIVSEAGTWDTDLEVPSIPHTYTQNNIALFRCDLGSSRSMITKTEKMSAGITQKTISPTLTYTFSGPMYVRGGRERVIV